MIRVHLCLTLLLLGAGCAATDSTVTLEGIGDRSHRSLPNVESALEAAQKEDPQVLAGFFSAPWVDDYPAFEDDGPAVTETAENSKLMDELRKAVAPDSWGAPGRRLFREGSWLVAIQTEEVLAAIHPWIETYTREQTETRSMVFTSMTVLRADDLDGLFQDVLGTPAPFPEVTVLPVTAKQTQSILEREGVVTLTAPRIALFSGQRGNVTVASQRAYVEDYQIYYVDGDRVADPVVGIVQDGITVDLRTKVTEDEDRVTVDMAVDVADFAGMEDAEVDVGGETLTIQLPDVATAKTRASYTQERGQTVLIAGPTLRGSRILILAESK